MKVEVKVVNEIDNVTLIELKANIKGFITDSYTETFDNTEHTIEEAIEHFTDELKLDFLAEYELYVFKLIDTKKGHLRAIRFMLDKNYNVGFLKDRNFGYAWIVKLNEKTATIKTDAGTEKITTDYLLHNVKQNQFVIDVGQLEKNY